SFAGEKRCLATFPGYLNGGATDLLYDPCWLARQGSYNNSLAPLLSVAASSPTAIIRIQQLFCRLRRKDRVIVSGGFLLRMGRWTKYVWHVPAKRRGKARSGLDRSSTPPRFSSA